MTVAEFCIYLLSHYPSDAKIFVYGGDEAYHSDDVCLYINIRSILPGQTCEKNN